MSRKSARRTRRITVKAADVIRGPLPPRLLSDICKLTDADLRTLHTLVRFRLRLIGEHLASSR